MVQILAESPYPHHYEAGMERCNLPCEPRAIDMRMRIITIYNYSQWSSAMHADTSSLPAGTSPEASIRVAPATVAACVELDSRRLFNGMQEVRIFHEGQEYRLRQTRNGKLILTK